MLPSRIMKMTYSFRHCDFVQLHGFLCLDVDSDADRLEGKSDRLLKVNIRG